MTQTIQIKVTIPGGFQHEGTFYSLDDVSTEPYELGLYFIKAGWASDTSGVVPSETPAINEVVLAPISFSSPTTTPQV